MHPLQKFFYGTGNRYPTGAEVHFHSYSPNVKCICGRFSGRTHAWGGACAEITGDQRSVFTDWIFGVDPLVSLHVLERLRRAEIKGFTAHPVIIDKVPTESMRRQKAPEYYVLEVTGRIDLDRELWDECKGDLCARCGSWRPGPGGSYGAKVEVAVEASWDGCDLMKWRNVNKSVTLVSRSLVALAQQCQWTGFGIGPTTYTLGQIKLSDPDWERRLAERIAVSGIPVPKPPAGYTRPPPLERSDPFPPSVFGAITSRLSRWCALVPRAVRERITRENVPGKPHPVFGEITSLGVKEWRTRICKTVEIDGEPRLIWADVEFSEVDSATQQRNFIALRDALESIARRYVELIAVEEILLEDEDEPPGPELSFSCVLRKDPFHAHALWPAIGHGGPNGSEWRLYFEGLELRHIAPAWDASRNTELGVWDDEDEAGQKE